MTVAAPVRRRHRGRVAIIVLAIVVVLLVAAAFVLDAVARAYASNLVETKVRDALSVPASDPVEAKIGGGPMLLQLASGRLERIDVDAAHLGVGALEGSATLTATGIPLDQAQPIDAARLRFTTDQAGLSQLLASFPRVPVKSVSVKGDTVTIGSSVTVFGVALPVGITFVPSAKDGQLVIAPRSVTVNGARVTSQGVRGLLGSSAADLFSSQTVCVAGLLPKGFTLRSIAVRDEKVTLVVDARSVVLSSSALSNKGSCPPAG